MGKLLGLIGVILAVLTAAIVVTILDEFIAPEPTEGLAPQRSQPSTD